MPDDLVPDNLVFATNRKAQVRVLIGGELLGAGIDNDGNLVSVDVNFDMDTMPPTCSLGMRSIPTWVKLKQKVEVDAGYNGRFARIFTRKVKRRRHGVAVSTVECAGRTSKLTQPFRTEPELFAGPVNAEDAILQVLNEDGVSFGPPTEQIKIEDTVADWVFDLDFSLDLTTAVEMIRQTGDLAGNRIYESRAGTLHIRPLLEVPAASPFRTYGTVGEDANVDTNVSFGDGTMIDTADSLGDTAANARRAQGWQPTVDGTAAVVGFWLKKVGNPTDNVQFELWADDNGGLPTLVGLGLGSSSKLNGQLLTTTDWTPVTMHILSGTELTAGRNYWVVVRRKMADGSDSPPDAANNYLVGRVSSGGYAAGEPAVYDSSGGTWSTIGSGDYVFTTVTTTFSALRLLDIGDDEDDDQVKKQVIVHGATLSGDTATGRTLLGGFDAEGNVISTQVYGEDHIVSDDLVPGKYQWYSMSYQNELIQSDALAVAVAKRLRDRFYRILDSIEIEVPFDPNMDLGVTLGIKDPRVTGKSGNWWVRAYHHSLSANSANTQVSLFGGDRGGTTGTSEPRPDFTWRMEQELLGNAVMEVVTFTAVVASPSSKIVDYHWTDDYAGGAMDASGPDLTSITRAYDPVLADTINVTLEVTDDQVPPQVVSITHAVDISGADAAGIYAPQMSCAAGNTCMITITGGRSWIDQVTPFGDIAKVTAITYDPNAPNDPLIFFFGTEFGIIYRTIDNNATLDAVYAAADADPITCIIPDIVRRGDMWATTTDRVLFSLDFGANWFVYTDFNDPANWSSTNSFVTFGFDDTDIDSTRALGDDTDRTRWADDFTPGDDEAGTLRSISFWLKREGNPADYVVARLYDNASDDPNDPGDHPGNLLATSEQILGASISNSVAQKVTFNMNIGLAGAKYHVVLDRTGGVDAANYYLISTKDAGAAERWYDLIDHGMGDVPNWVGDTKGLVIQIVTSHLVGVIGGPIDPRPINRIIGSDPSVNRVWIMGGRGDVVESWFHTNYIPDGGGPGAWHSETSEGDGVAAFPRDPADTVVDSVVSNGTSGDLGLMFKSAGAPWYNPYIFSKLFHPVGQADWKFGSGQMANPGDGGVGVENNNLQLQIFLALLDSKDAYGSPDGLGFIKATDVLPGTVDNRPHHLINVNAWRDIYLSAMDEGIAKTIDNGVTWAFFRPMGDPINTTWPAGAQGWEIAFDYRGPAATPSFKLLLAIHSGSRTATVIRTGIGPWKMQSDDGTDWPTVDLYSFPSLNRIFRTRNSLGNPDPENGTWETLQYSDNLGITWIDTTVVECPDVTRAQNGDLYALSTGGDVLDGAHRVYRSVDDGDNWTLAHNDTTDYPAGFGHPEHNTRYRRIVADPIDKDHIIAVSYEGAFLKTVTATTSNVWSRGTPTFGDQFAERTNICLAFGQPVAGKSRIFVAWEKSAAQSVVVAYSDDDGADWHTSLDQSSSGNEPPRVMFDGAKDIYFMHAALLVLHGRGIMAQAGNTLRTLDSTRSYVDTPGTQWPISCTAARNTTSYPATPIQTSSRWSTRPSPLDLLALGYRSAQASRTRRAIR